MTDRQKELALFVEKILKEAVDKQCTVEELVSVLDKLKEDGKKLKLTM